MGAKIGITPVFQFNDLLSHKNLDGLPQLLFKQAGVKTHPREHCFDIIQHGSEFLFVGHIL